MTTQRLFAGLVAGSMVASSGCALIATKSEYADYRAVRVAESDRDRLVAMQAYVENNPRGYWYEEFASERSSREAEIFESGKTTREGLEFYLAAYPQGAYVEQARPRLAALQAVQGRRENEADRAREAQANRRQQREEQRRTWVTRAIGYWTRTMLGVQNWGSPIADLARGNPAFSRAFGENPRPRCTATECDKFYQNAYAIPVPGATRIDRTIQIVLRLRMEAGNVERAELLLPSHGFSRWYEMENRVAVTDEDPTQREQVIAWVLERLVPVVTTGLTGAQPLEGITLSPIEELAFTPEGTRTGTSTPGSGGAADEEDDDDEAPQTTPPAATSTATAPAATATPTTTDATVDQLLATATGTSVQTPVAEAPAAVATEPAVEAPPAPVAPALARAFTNGNLRVVIFSASEEDYGTAHDGIYIERIR